ncbi:MAG TPA: DUF4416 family protein [Rectinemataceae bacterium]|nr:DUF4416 family protein [Rectinemataceae bacterium]
MASPRPFPGARLVVAILSQAGDSEVLAPFGPLLPALEKRFGPPDYFSSGLSFSWTNYYADELGPSILRSFLSFPLLVDPSTLASIKTWTNELEERFAVGSRRRFNLDPGLLSLGGFVLATTKGRSHRIALSEGIYAELTLMYANGGFRSLPWTYADWKSPEYGAVLSELRGRLKLALRGSGPRR